MLSAGHASYDGRIPLAITSANGGAAASLAESSGASAGHSMPKSGSSGWTACSPAGRYVVEHRYVRIASSVRAHKP